MTKEDLLIPRWKVKIKYPRSVLPIGSIFTVDIESIKVIYPDGKQGLQSSYHVDEPEDYPDVFDLLPWYVERNEIDLPTYIKYIKNKGKSYEEIIYMKVDRWVIDGEYTRPCDFGIMAFKSVESTPITAVEYEAYLQTTNK